MSKPRPGLEPLPLSGADRDAKRQGGLLLRQTSEVAAFDDGGEPAIALGELPQREVDFEDARGVGGSVVACLVERNHPLVAAALDAGATPRVIHDDLPHRDRADREEMTAIAPRRLRLVHQPEVGLVHEAARVERLRPAPTAELDPRQPPEVLVDQRHQLVERLGIAGAVGEEQLGNVYRQKGFPSRGGMVWRTALYQLGDHSKPGMHRPLPRTPAGMAAVFERGVPLPAGPGDCYAGYAVLDLRFTSGDVLALRRFPSASVGIGYTSVWHRGPDGVWTLYADVPPGQGCGRHFGSLASHAVVAPIRIHWTDARSLSIEVDSGQRLKWKVELASSAVTTAFNAAATALPPSWWTSRRALKITQPLVDFALWAGRLRLFHRLPDGVRVRVLPQALWAVDASRAVLAGRDFGPLKSFGGNRKVDIWPQRRTLFAAGAMIVRSPRMADSSPVSR